MSKLVFYYGVMGSSKTALALIKRFSYIEHGKKVLLLKPSIDTRDGFGIIKSRAGLEAPTIEVSLSDNLIDIYKNQTNKIDRIIIDEAQFLSKEQVEQLKDITTYYEVAVDAYGLKVNFKAELFEGSKRLLELCDKEEHLESICDCGTLAIINARYNKDTGMIIYDGPEVLIGGNDSYKAVCYGCWKNGKVNEKQVGDV